MEGKFWNVAKKFFRAMRYVDAISREETYPSQDFNICQDVSRFILVFY